MPAPSQTYDVIVVLGGPPSALKRRTAQGIRLFHAGRAGALLVTGRGRKPFVEAEAMSAQARAAGVPAECIVVEDRARSTWENAAYAAPIMRAYGWRRALIVTDPPHLPRALLAFQSQGIDASGSAAVGWQDEPLPTRLAYLWHEALGLAWYAVLALVRRRRR